MRESVKLIKWCSIAAMLFLVLTYVVTVNSESHLISFDSLWISNNFFITLFGGIFASMLVVDLCEVQKYLSMKANTEQYLFYQSLYLYQAIRQMKIIMEDYINHSEWRIPENLLDESVRMIQSEINALQVTDYATFKYSENSLMVQHRKFCIETIPEIQPILQSGIRLKLAINETEKENLQEQFETHTHPRSRKQVTSESPRVVKMLSEELVIIYKAVELVDNYLTTLDSCCNKKFKWDMVKEKLEFFHIEDLN